MNIQVRIATAQAQTQLKALQGRIAELEAEVRTASKSSSGFTSGFSSATSALERFGSRTQWAGRQLTANFTVPIALAGAAATKFELDNQTAITRVSKVYGDLSMPVSQVKSEVNALSKAFIALSDQYGVQQKDVIDIAGAWAAAGSSGVALAKATELTLRTMVLGEIDATKATTALISIQAQYKQSTAGLSNTINTLNVIENQTGISMAGLIDGFQRAAGVAANAGIDVDHLGALLAALTPAAGSAAQAGNALKTMISRLLDPTKEAAQVLTLMGVNIDSASWKSSNATERLLVLAHSFKGLSDSQQAVVSATIASRFQINKFDVLMNALNSSTSYYQKSLDATANRTLVFNQATKELNQVLDSNPQKLKQIGVILQNSLAEIITPLIPTILMLAGAIQHAVTWFSNLSGPVQKAVGLMLLFVAGLGPVLKYIGSIGTALGYMGSLLEGVGSAIGAVGGFFAVLGTEVLAGFAAVSAFLIGVPGMITKLFGVLAAASSKGIAGILALLSDAGEAIVALILGPWGLAIAGVAAILILFRHQVAQLWHNIVNSIDSGALSTVFQPVIRIFDAVASYIASAFDSLPKSVQNAMQAVVNIVYQAAMAVYNLFSYLNPFAHHSPSLVENVTKGMDVVTSQFARLTNVQGSVNSAYATLQKFGKQVAGFEMSGTKKDNSKTLATVKANTPSALPAARQLITDQVQLQLKATALTDAINKQQGVVDGWSAKLDKANDALDAQQKALDALQKISDAYSDSLTAAQDQLNNWVQTPIAGMKAMQDQIFANDQAQKALQLQMLQMGDAVGGIDQVTNKLSALNGEIETLRGTQADLRASGAGSDILSGFDSQIAGLQGQTSGITQTLTAYQQLSDQLDKLQTQGQELDLQNSLQFDPLTKQIQDAANAMNELPFDQIMTGVQASAADVVKYTAAFNTATAAVNAQKAIVDSYTASRDVLQASYDTENKKLQTLKDSYDKVNTAISDINSSLSQMTQAADSAHKAAGGAGGGLNSPGAQNFKAAAGGNFPNVLGKGKIGREGTAADQSKQINDFTTSLSQKTANMLAGFDIFGPIKGQWKKFTDWWSKQIQPTLAPAKTAFSNLFAGVDFTKPFQSLKTMDWTWLTSIAQTFSGVFGDLINLGKLLVNFFKADFVHLFEQIWSNLKEGFGDLAKEFVGFGPVMQSLGKALHNLWSIMKPIYEILYGSVIIAFKIFVNLLSNLVGPALHFIFGVLSNLIQIIRGVAEIVVGVLTLNWGMAIKGMKDIAEGTLGAIGDLFKFLAQVIYGIAKSIVEDVVDFFQWLYDELVGHSIIPDLVNAIIDWIGSIPGLALTALADLGKLLFSLFVDAFNLAWEGFKTVWTTITGWLGGLGVKAYDAAKAVITELGSLARDGFVAMKNAFVSTWDTVSGWLSGVGGKVVSAIGTLTKTLGSKGIDIISGLWDGIKGRWDDVSGWFGSLGSKIQSALSSIFQLDKLLVSAGVDIMKGLLSGINQGWQDVKDFVGGLGGWIRDHKGPKAYDMALLVPHGNWIMGGFNSGLKDGFNEVKATVTAFGPQIASAFNAVGNVTANDLKNMTTARATSTTGGPSSDSGPGGASATTAYGATGTTTNEYHFHGDLSFPNVKTADDAEEFLKNLEVVAGKGN